MEGLAAKAGSRGDPEGALMGGDQPGLDRDPVPSSHAAARAEAITAEAGRNAFPLPVPK